MTMPPLGPWTLGDYTTAGAALTKKVLMYGCVEAAGASGRRLGGCQVVYRGSVAGDLGATGCVKLMCQVAAAMCNRSPNTV